MMVLLLKKTLAKNGYTVLVALDGEAALNLFDLHKEEIDIVLLDIGLPRKDGGDVVLKMKKERPDINVIVSSGYIDPETKANCIGPVSDILSRSRIRPSTCRNARAISEKT